LFLALGGIVVLAGCSSQHYRRSADKEAYRLIAEKTPRVPNMDTNFTIETNLLVSLENLAVVEKSEEAMGEDGKAEIGCRIVPLDTALEIAVKNSRNYQTRKETLYLEALNLSLARHHFTPIFSGGASAQVKDGVDKLTAEHSVSGNGNIGADVLLHSGARIATDFTTDFFRFILGDPSMVTSSRLAGTLTQPLLRGGGYKVTMENLTQAERNLLYALRDFVQFRRDYVVQVASGYYGVLRNRDAVRNTWQSFQSFKTSAARQRAFIDEGQGAIADLARYQQNELDNESRLVSAIRTYKQGLDQFKIQLGLPTDARIVLDDGELRRLQIIPTEVSPEEAIRVALVSRLDFLTTKNQFEDAARKIVLAKNGLLPDLDVVLAANVPSKPGSGLPELDFKQATWGGSVNLGLPLDRKAERNTYRSSLIAYERARRTLELEVDNIKLDILNTWRQLDEAKRTYESSVVGVQIAEQRVAEQDLLEELGRGNSEAKSNSQDALTASLNGRTAAMVNYNVARLSLWRSMGILNIKDNGQWEEVNNVKTSQ
jgi:outer membrane protein TolC